MAQPLDAGPVYGSEYDYPVKLTFAGQLFIFSEYRCLCLPCNERLFVIL